MKGQKAIRQLDELGRIVLFVGVRKSLSWEYGCKIAANQICSSCPEVSENYIFKQNCK